MSFGNVQSGAERRLRLDEMALAQLNEAGCEMCKGQIVNCLLRLRDGDGLCSIGFRIGEAAKETTDASACCLYHCRRIADGELHRVGAGQREIRSLCECGIPSGEPANVEVALSQHIRRGALHGDVARLVPLLSGRAGNTYCFTQATRSVEGAHTS